MGVVRMEAGEITDSDLSDCESEVVQSAFAPRPGFLKRTYGGDLASDDSLEHRRKSAKLEEQLDGLRAVLPDGATRSRERANVVLDAYHYIAALQRQVEDLNAELLEDEDAATSVARDEQGQWSLPCCHSGLRLQPLVDVARGDGLLEVRIVCANRPGLLVDVMEAVEARGLTIVQVRIACRDEIVVEYLTLESEVSESDLLLDGEKKADSSGDEEEEVDRVKAMLVHAICKGGNEDLQ